MKGYEIVRTNEFIRNLRKFSKNKELLKAFEKKFDVLKMEPLNIGKYLEKDLYPNRSLRIHKRYRLIYQVKGKTVYLKTIGHRKNVYS